MGRLYVYEDLQSEEEVIVEFTCLSTFPGFLFMWRLPHDLRHPAFCNLIVYFSRMFTSMHTRAIKTALSLVSIGHGSLPFVTFRARLPYMIAGRCRYVSILTSFKLFSQKKFDGFATITSFVPDQIRHASLWLLHIQTTYFSIKPFR